jgi:hypothetical protein
MGKQDWRPRLAQRYVVAAIISAGAGFGLYALQTPWWLAFITSLVLFSVIALFAAVRTPTEIPKAKIEGGRERVLNEVMGDARPALAKIETFITTQPRNNVRDLFAKIHERAAAIMRDVEEQPGRIATAQRALTYYLPRAGDLADAYTQLRARPGAAPERLADIETVLGKLNDAFAHFQTAIVDEDMRALDAELDLLKDAVREDVGDR